LNNSFISIYSNTVFIEPVPNAPSFLDVIRSIATEESLHVLISSRACRNGLACNVEVWGAFPMYQQAETESWFVFPRCYPRNEATKDLFIAIRSYAVRRKDETQKQQILKFFHKNKTEQV